jgi:hypothetical protein
MRSRGNNIKRDVGVVRDYHHLRWDPRVPITGGLGPDPRAFFFLIWREFFLKKIKKKVFSLFFLSFSFALFLCTHTLEPVLGCLLSRIK